MTFWSDSFPKARVSHRCDDCGRTIDPGETYRKGAGMDGGTAWTWKECNHCLAYITFTDMWCNDDYSSDTLAEYEPANATEERWARQYRRRWRTSQGGLFPIPARAKAIA